MIRIAVVDDDDHDAALIDAMLRRYYEGDLSNFTITRFNDGESLLNGFASNYDMLFLDIEMPGIDGLEVARRIRLVDDEVVLVFTTIMAQYAAEGYDVDAIGYLIKPIEYHGFALKMKKAELILSKRSGISFPVRCGSSIQYISSSTIRYVEVCGHEILYHYAQGKVLRVWGVLHEVADRLRDENFVLISRYCLINLRWVTGFARGMVNVDGKELLVSRSKKKPLMLALASYYGC